MKYVYLSLLSIFFLFFPINKLYALDVAKKFNSEYINDVIFSREQFEEDLNYLLDALEQGHPNAFYLNNKEDIYSVFKNVPVKESYTSIEIQRYSLSILNKLGDDHSGIYPYGDENFYPPYKIKKINEKFYITESSSTDFLVGDEITFIDNKPMSFIWNNLGEISKNPYGRILDEDIFHNFKELMSVRYEIPHLYYKEKTVVVRSDSAAHNLGCKSVSADEVHMYECEDIPVIKIDKFKYKEENNGLISSYISKHKNIIIDLRNNAGGSLKLAKNLFELFLDKNKSGNFFIKNAVLLKGSTYSKISYDMRLNFLFKKILYIGEQDRAQQAHWESEVPSLFYANSIYEKASYQGKSNIKDRRIYILVNSNTGSAAALLAGLFKEHLNAILIGQEMFSSYTRFFGDPIFVVLPNSKLRINFSSAYSDRTGATDYPSRIAWPEENDLGVQPDIYLDDNRSDLTNGFDSVLNRAIKEIKSE